MKRSKNTIPKVGQASRPPLLINLVIPCDYIIDTASNVSIWCWKTSVFYVAHAACARANQRNQQSPTRGERTGYLDATQPGQGKKEYEGEGSPPLQHEKL